MSEAYWKSIWMLAAAAATVLWQPYRPVVVCGSSMQPALQDHEFTLVDGRAYDRGPVRKNDVVVFRLAGRVYVKRVVAVGGQSVRLACTGNGLTLVPRHPDEVSWMRRYAARHPDRLRFRLHEVPPGCLYVVGDNQTASIDSRHFGPVPLSAVIGRIVTEPGRVYSV